MHGSVYVLLVEEEKNTHTKNNNTRISDLSAEMKFRRHAESAESAESAENIRKEKSPHALWWLVAGGYTYRD